MSVIWVGASLFAVGCASDDASSDRTVVHDDDDDGVHQEGGATPAMILRQSFFDAQGDPSANARYVPFDREALALAYDKASEIRGRGDLGQLPNGESALPSVTAYTAYNLPNAIRTPVERIWVKAPNGATEQYVRAIKSSGDGDWYLTNTNDPATAASSYAQAGNHTGMFVWHDDEATGLLFDGNDEHVGGLPDVSIEDIDALTPFDIDAGALQSHGDVSVRTAAREEQLTCSEDLGDCDFEFHGGSYECRVTIDGSLSQTWWREETDPSTADTLIGFHRVVPLVDGVPEFSCATPVRTLSQSALEDIEMSAITAEGAYVAAYNPNVATPSRYVALGDSYSSGAGLLPYIVDRTPDPSDDRCQRGKAGWPEMIATAIGAQAGSDRLGDPYSNSACGGAKTTDVMETGQWPGMQPQLVNVDEDADMITISIGGNDLGFGPLLRGCVLGGNYPGSNPDCRTYPVEAPEGVERRTFAEEIDMRLRILGGETSVQDQVLVDADDPSRVIWPIYDVLEAVIDRAGPSTKIRVVGIPPVMSGDTIPATASCLVGLTGDEALWIDGIVDRLNDVSHNAVLRAQNHAANVSPNGGIIDIQFVDPSSVFEGHGACAPQADQRWINLVDIDTADADWAPWKWKADGSLHPNAEGAFQIAKLVLESL